VEVKGCRVIPVLLKHCNTRIIAGCFDRKGKQAPPLNTSWYCVVEAPDEMALWPHQARFFEGWEGMWWRLQAEGRSEEESHEVSFSHTKSSGHHHTSHFYQLYFSIGAFRHQAWPHLVHW